METKEEELGKETEKEGLEEGHGGDLDIVEEMNKIWEDNIERIVDVGVM